MPASRKQLALQTVLESYEMAKIAREPFKKKWDEYFMLSKGIVSKKKYKWMTNRFVPYIPAFLDLILPRLAAKRPGAEAVGRDEDSALKQEKFNKLLSYEQDLMNIDVVLTEWIYDVIRYGTSFLKLSWKKEKAKNLTRTKSFIEKMKGYLSKLGLKFSEDDLLYDGPDLENTDIFEMFVDPKAKNRRTARFIIQRSEQTKTMLRQNPNYKNLSELKSLSGEIDENRRNRLSAMGLSSGQANHIIENAASDYHEVLEYWGLFDIDGDDEEEECVITVADGSVVLRFEENPFYHGQKPFIVLRYKPEPHFFYGEGICERLKECQYELNDIANQSSDMRKLTLQPIIKIKRQANLDVETLKIAPGMPIPLEDPNDLVFERPPDFTNQLEFVSKAIREIMQVATGATDVILGQGDVGIAANTLGGAQIAQEQSNLRFRIPALMLDGAIEDYGDMLISLNQQYFDRKKTIKVFGEQGVEYKEIAPSDISGKFSYKVQTMSMAPQSKLSRRTELVNLKSLYVDNPKINQDKLDKLIIESFDIDPESLIQEGGQTIMPAVERMKQAMTPEQIQAYMTKLNPQNREIMRKAFSLGTSNQRGALNETLPIQGRTT